MDKWRRCHDIASSSCKAPCRRACDWHRPVTIAFCHVFSCGLWIGNRIGQQHIPRSRICDSHAGDCLGNGANPASVNDYVWRRPCLLRRISDVQPSAAVHVFNDSSRPHLGENPLCRSCFRQFGEAGKNPVSRSVRNNGHFRLDPDNCNDRPFSASLTVETAWLPGGHRSQQTNSLGLGENVCHAGHVVAHATL